jgi:hypothetical protein
MNDHDFQISLTRQRTIKDKALAQVMFRNGLPLIDRRARFPGFRQRKVSYQAGQRILPGASVLLNDIVLHESVPTVFEDE